MLKLLSVTFSKVDPVTPELLAEMVVTPRAMPETTPPESTEAWLTDEDPQFVNLVRSTNVAIAELAGRGERLGAADLYCPC